MSTPKDGMNLLLSSYAEIQIKRPVDANPSNLAYSIKCDPAKFSLKLSGNQVAGIGQDGLFASKGDNTALIAAGSAVGDIVLSKWTNFQGNFREYKVNFVNVSVMVDRGCGLDNPITFLTDVGDSNPPADMGVVQAQAHKQYTMTESRRTALYGWKPRTVKEKEYKLIATADAMNDSEFHFIKVFQDLEPADVASICKHKITVTMGVTLKDSKNLN